MLVTVLGIVTDVRHDAPLNTLLFITVMLSGIVKFVTRLSFMYRL